ncbi:OLC1v1006371C1 [Oldenlandia corymbosa var. corymbosa]|uniref:OLC1v1006371C1 n=1 Tax=Oldenlandia corymbosa var. corymbosa TaxID=529605 RepID=A0AAV1DGX0_OLDCO|nr:OLC1v1006371C1 [Oldenlandia corymbosa var. corymbosa]
MAGPLVIFYLLLQFTAIATSTCHKPLNHSMFPAIFTFGDSFLDTGNNNFLPTIIKANHAPYGQNLPGRIATGRFTDGRIFAEFVAGAVNIKNTIPPFLDPSLSTNSLRSGVCFASAGAGYDDLTTLLTNALPVSRQVQNFADYLSKLNLAVGEIATKNIVKDSLTIIVAGTNDFIANVYQTPTRQIHFGLSGYQDILQQKIQTVIENLYNQGLRKFLVAGLPPIGCLPFQITTKLGFIKCIEDENLDSQRYNQKLIALLPNIQAKLPGSKIVYADIYTPISDMVARPESYGLTVTNRGCCGTGLVEAAFLCKQFSPVCPNPNQYLFWDAANPSETGHKILARFLLDHAVPQFFTKSDLLSDIF